MSPDPARILVVCTGNVCRSPFIERGLQAELDRLRGSGEVVVESAGTGALVGEPMDAQAHRALQGKGYSADGFRARALTPELVASADLVLTATRRHRGQVATMHPKALRYVFTLRELADLLRDVDPGPVAAGADAPPRPAREAVREVVRLAAGQRGMRPPLSDQDADVVDPYRRDDSVFETMASQVMAALPAVAAHLGRR